ncbi:ABC transporter permease [Paucisalibacillus sp. EB02]|uniref:ABC transporter permease n=1 Tax=Paucisalibacillus sp. EB02 TaxID=1347087 RepID=UPI0005A97E23|nr:FtsX-like permease family protein [Paucisalibacillus sp. EB02]
MKIIIKHVIKNIFEKKLRSAIVLLTILLSTLVLFIGLSLNSIINETYSTMLQGAYGDANLIVNKNTDDGNPFYETSELELAGLNSMSRLDLIQVNGKTKLNGDEKTVSLYGMDTKTAKEMDLIDVISGEVKLGNDAVIISQRIASDYGLAIGDRLEITRGKDTYDFNIGGISKPDGLFYSEKGDVLLITDSLRINDIYGTSNMVASTLLQVPTEEIDSTIASLREINDNFVVQKTNAADSILRDEQTFQMVMMLSIIIIVLISAYVISSLTKLIITERLPVMGTFRSVGAHKGMMNRVLFLEFFVYGVIGSVLGIVLAVILLPYAADVFNEYKEYGVETIVTYNAVYLFTALLFGMIFPALISFFRILKANSKPLKEVLFDTSFTPEKRSKWGLILGILLLALAFLIYFVNRYDDILLAILSLLLLFVSIVMLMPTLLNGISRFILVLLGKSTAGEFKIGIKNIAGNKIVANNVSMIMVVFLLLLMVGISSAGIDRYVTNTLEKDFDVTLSLPDNNLAIADEIKEMDGVSESYKQTISLGISSLDGVQTSIVIQGVNDFTVMDDFYEGIKYLDIDKDKLINLENAIILDEYMTKKYGLSIGDIIEIQPVDLNDEPIEHSKPMEMVVSGTMDSSGFSSSRNSALISMPFFETYFAGIFHELVLRVKDGYTAEELKESITDSYINHDLEVITFDEMLGSQKATIDTLIDGITMIIGLGMIVGVLGISNNLMVSFNQRKKEYAILYSVCMSKGQIVKMLLSEMLTTFLAVVIIGLFGGFALNILLTKLLYAIGMQTEFDFTFGLFGLLSLIVVILLSLSSLSLVRKVFKLNIMKELRYE